MAGRPTHSWMRSHAAARSSSSSGVVVGPASVYQAVVALREPLGDIDPTPTYIATIPRKGYRLVARILARNVDSLERKAELLASVRNRCSAVRSAPWSRRVASLGVHRKLIWMKLRETCVPPAYLERRNSAGRTSGGRRDSSHSLSASGMSWRLTHLLAVSGVHLNESASNPRSGMTVLDRKARA